MPCGDNEERLERELEEVREQNRAFGEVIDRQGEEVAQMAKAMMDIRQEDAELLNSYRRVNTLLVAFAEEVAGSRSKFARKARKILGF